MFALLLSFAAGVVGFLLLGIGSLAGGWSVRPHLLAAMAFTLLPGTILVVLATQEPRRWSPEDIEDRRPRIRAGLHLWRSGNSLVAWVVLLVVMLGTSGIFPGRSTGLPDLGPLLVEKWPQERFGSLELLFIFWVVCTAWIARKAWPRATGDSDRAGGISGR